VHAAMPKVLGGSDPTIPPSWPNPTNDPVGVLSCFLMTSAHKGLFEPSRGGFHARFRNLSNATLDRVVFRAKYGSGGIDFVEVGAFGPGFLVKHDLFRKISGPDPMVVVSIDEPASCDVVSAHFAGGATWLNPAIGATEPLPPAVNATPVKYAARIVGGGDAPLTKP
jgi:hypothetical protein